MWRIFEAKPRTRLGRLSHARTHDDILDLVGHDDDVGDDGDNYDYDINGADSYMLAQQLLMISLTWLIVDIVIGRGYFNCDPKYQVDAYSLEENEFYVDRDPGDLFSFNSTSMVIDIR